MAITPTVYDNNRPAASFKVSGVHDQGIVLKHGSAPNGEDAGGARDAFVYQANGAYYMTYDGAGPNAWNTVLAKSTDLTNWTPIGNILPLGDVGSDDQFCVCYANTSFDGSLYRMYYTTADNQSAPPYVVPNAPYGAMEATATSPEGPWTKKSTGNVIPLVPGSYHSIVATAGSTIQYGGQYMMFFSTQNAEQGTESVGIARSNSPDGPWTPDPTPALPDDKIENPVVWYQASSKTYFMFIDHSALKNGVLYTDAVWVYWTQDPNNWNGANKAVVIDGSVSTWSKYVIGIPAVQQVGDRLAVIYDGRTDPNAPTGIADHLQRDIGLAWLDLPIKLPN